MSHLSLLCDFVRENIINSIYLKEDEVDESRSILNVAGSGLIGDVDHDCLSTNLSIVENQMERILERLEKLLSMIQENE